MSSMVGLAFTMHEGMDGPHDFAIVMRTNDPVEPEKSVNVKANFIIP
ncbi:MAG: hypothetical protein HY675_07615 [Chloroflexi bacterium]|nr:hypothetical protein [Chloroflexota bacterium]